MKIKKTKLSVEEASLAKKALVEERALQAFAETNQQVASAAEALEQAERARAKHKEDEDMEAADPLAATKSEATVEGILSQWKDLVATIRPDFLKAANLQVPEVLVDMFSRVGQAA